MYSVYIGCLIQIIKSNVYTMCELSFQHHPSINFYRFSLSGVAGHFNIIFYVFFFFFHSKLSVYVQLSLWKCIFSKKNVPSLCTIVTFIQYHCNRTMSVLLCTYNLSWERQSWTHACPWRSHGQTATSPASRRRNSSFGRAAALILVQKLRISVAPGLPGESEMKGSLSL